MIARRATRRTLWTIATLAALGLAAAGARLLMIDGWLRSVRIDGASMAATLCGTHVLVTCSDCGISFPCDAEHVPASGEVVCPNCGFQKLSVSEFPRHRGDRVRIDRWPAWRGNLNRWDIVALEDPLAEGLSVKRIAGMPGELISIAGGDVYCRGEIIRKTLDQTQEMAVLIHDNEHAPQSMAATGNEAGWRWKPADATSDWSEMGGVYRYRPGAQREASEPDWLEYTHWRCDGSLTSRNQPAPILDNDPYNQAQSRQLNEVTDVWLTFEVELAPSGELLIELLSAGKAWQVELNGVSGSIELTCDGRPLDCRAVEGRLDVVPAHIAFGYLDAQVCLAIDGQQWRWPVNAANPMHIGAESRLAVAASGGACTLRSLRIWRDVYYLEPNGTSRPWSMEEALAADEYFLLGDNVPVSIDGRHWQSRGTPAQGIRGVVTPVHARR